MRTALAMSFLCLAGTIASAEQLEPKQAFFDNHCRSCHSISAQGIEKVGPLKIEGGDLSTIGDRRKKAKWLKDYLRAKKKGANGLKHNQIPSGKMIVEGLPIAQYKGTDEELDALANWLVTLKESKD